MGLGMVLWMQPSTANQELFPHNTRLQLYQVSAVTQGTDAQAEVTVRLEEDSKTANGQGTDTDTMVASVSLCACFKQVAGQAGKTGRPRFRPSNSRCAL